MNASERGTTDLLTDTLAAHPGGSISLDALLQPLHTRAFGVLLLLLAIPNFIPAPVGVGGVMGVLVIGLGLQMLAGLEQPWIPRRVRQRAVKRLTVERFLKRCAPLMRRLERLCNPRLQRLTRRPASMVSGLVLVLLGILLALPIPFTNYVFGVILLAFAFALIERDGVLLLVLWIGSVAMVFASASFSDALIDLIQRIY